jgi:glutamate formiminotransferase/glutamate formiminotransferase/formiminotetrahydrofolate cyclodeaminase
MASRWCAPASCWSERPGLDTLLLAVPNFSEGRDTDAVAAISTEFARGAGVVDRHTDPVHNRTVVTVSGPAASLPAALAAGASACIERIDMTTHEGAHPCIGALDVCPLVWLDQRERASASEQALETAIAIGDLGVPVFLYGELASDPRRRERAYFREGGTVELARRMRSGELRPDFGPPEPHPTAGATLVSARPPLAAFNLELDTADANVARMVAASLRESGGGLGGVRAIGIDLDGRAQVSTNIHDPIGVPLAMVVERTAALAAEHGAKVVRGEVVGLVPEAALRGLPDDLSLPGFDSAFHVIERRLRVH